jgi:hypothetical protein
LVLEERPGVTLQNHAIEPGQVGIPWPLCKLSTNTFPAEEIRGLSKNETTRDFDVRTVEESRAIDRIVAKGSRLLLQKLPDAACNLAILQFFFFWSRGLASWVI